MAHKDVMDTIMSFVSQVSSLTYTVGTTIPAMNPVIAMTLEKSNIFFK